MAENNRPDLSLIGKPFQRGISPNPGGRPKVAAFRRALRRVYLGQAEAAATPDMRGRTGKLDAMISKLDETTMRVLAGITTVEEYATFMAAMQPYLQFMADMMDGKEAPPKADAVATKENRTYIVGGEVVRTEEVQTVTQTSEITGVGDEG